MTTVHRAIYGKEGVSENLRNQILATAERMGYVTNYAASSIKRKAIRIAVVLPPETGVGALYFAYFWKGYRQALREADALNVQTDEYIVESEEEQVSVLKAIEEAGNNQYRGVLTVSYTHSQRILRQYERITAKDIVVMLLDDSINDIPGLYCVSCNDKYIGELCGEMFSLMLPDTGTILASSGNEDHINTLNGFRSYLREHKSHLNVELVSGKGDLYEGFRNRLSSNPNVVGTFALIARENRPMVRALEDLGLCGQVKAIGADLNLESAQYLRDGKVNALVYKNPYDKASLGFRMLVNYLVRHEEPPKNIECIIGMVFKTSLHFYEDVIKL